MGPFLRHRRHFPGAYRSRAGIQPISRKTWIFWTEDQGGGDQMARVLGLCEIG